MQNQLARPPQITTIRRLSAIMAVDVVGYSHLMGKDEEGTHDRLKAHRRELIDPKIAEYRGRIVKTTGDGLLVEFSSVVDAIRCAAEVQRAMIDRDAGVPKERRIVFRIGINLGDVISDDGDIFGDGVNVAARLEGLADPGGICISGTVYDHIRDKLPYPLDDLGEQHFKNIARPVRVYSLPRRAVAALPPIPDTPLALRKGYSRRVLVAGVGSVLAVGLGAVAALWPFRPQTAPSYAAAQRTALVVGNSRYKNLPLLPNAERDAAMVSAALETHGFRVIKKIDADREVLVQAVTDFETTLSVAGGVGLFYYAGSAAYVGGVDIILPVDATEDLTEMKIQGGINLTRLSAGIKAKITKKVADNGSAVIYSASKGQEASDGPPGQNSPFARAFLAALDNEEDELGDVFRHIRQAMAADQNMVSQAAKQTPYFEDSRTSRFYFSKPENEVAGILRVLVFNSCRDNPFKLAVAEN